MDLGTFKTSDHRHEITKVTCIGYSCALKVQIDTFAYQLELSIIVVFDTCCIDYRLSSLSRAPGIRNQCSQTVLFVPSIGEQTLYNCETQSQSRRDKCSKPYFRFTRLIVSVHFIRDE